MTTSNLSWTIRHHITVRGTYMAGDSALVVNCSCSEEMIGRVTPTDGTIRIPLDELTRLAHEHIERADRRPIV